VEIKSHFEKFSQELVQLKETEDFVEHDLKRLQQTVHELNQELKRLTEPPEIELCMEQSNQIVWDTLIYVQEKPSFAAKQQRQQQEVNGKCIVRSVFLVRESPML
jgi:hypothetical protein